MDFPWGKRAIMDEHGVVERLADDAPVEYWVCCREDQPWTWRVLSNQHIGRCVRCGCEVIYRISARTPTDPAVKKICTTCAERLAAE